MASSPVFVAVLLVAVAVGPARTTPVRKDVLGDVETPETTLVQLQALFRHGARTPTDAYATDPYANSTYPPYGLGHLTPYGRQLEFQLGKFLRQRYIGDDGNLPTSGTALLDSEYATGVVKINTSEIERTQESVAAFSAGLWRPGPKQAWTTDGSNLGGLWMPIPYHIVPLDQDYSLAGMAPCPARDVETERVNQDPDFIQSVVDVLGGQDTLDYLKENAGLTDTAMPEQTYLVYSALQCQELLGMPIPEWSRLVYPEPLRSAAWQWLKSLSYTPKLRRLAYHGLTSSILDNSRSYKSQPKLFVYSAHDATVQAAIQIFHLVAQAEEGNGLPDFSACLLFEVHVDEKGTIGLQFFYRRHADATLVRMIPEGCDAFCPLERLEQILADNQELRTDADSCDDNSGLTKVAVNAHLKHVKGRGQ